MKDEEFGEIPRETRRCFAEADEEKIFMHLPVPPRSLALRRPWIDGGCPEFEVEVSPAFATPYLEFSESWYRRRKGPVFQQGQIFT